MVARFMLACYGSRTSLIFIKAWRKALLNVTSLCQHHLSNRTCSGRTNKQVPLLNNIWSCFWGYLVQFAGVLFAHRPCMLLSRFMLQWGSGWWSGITQHKEGSCLLFLHALRQAEQRHQGRGSTAVINLATFRTETGIFHHLKGSLVLTSFLSHPCLDAKLSTALLNNRGKYKVLSQTRDWKHPLWLITHRFLAAPASCLSLLCPPSKQLTQIWPWLI